MQAKAQTRVVHVSSAHRWTDNRIHFREATSIAEAGYDVHLVAVEHDLCVRSTPVTVRRLPHRGRMARVTIGSAHAVLVALRTGAEIFHLHDPELVWAIPILKALGRTVIYDAHEDLPAQTLNKHYLPRRARPLVAWLAHAAVRIASSSHHVIAATESIARTFPEQKVSVVHNYPRTDVKPHDPKPITSRPNRLVYVGAISQERGVGILLDTMIQPEFPTGWEVALAGEASPASLLADMRKRPCWARVDYRGFVPPDQAQLLMEQSRLGILLLQRNKAYLESLPTKLFEYFAAGIPVIASDFPLWRPIILEHDCGTLVDETDPSAVARAIASYAQDSEKLTRQGLNARALAMQSHNWTAEALVLMNAYDKARANRRGRCFNVSKGSLMMVAVVAVSCLLSGF